MNRPQKVSQTPPGDPLAPVREKLVQSLSLAPEGSIAHSVARHRDGLRVMLDRGDCELPVYAYALPWARGWSVFVTHHPDATSHTWHNYATGFSQSVPNPRNVTGPQNVDIDKLSSSLIDAIDYLEYHYTERPDGYDDTPYDHTNPYDPEEDAEEDDNNGTSVIFNGLP